MQTAEVGRSGRNRGGQGGEEPGQKRGPAEGVFPGFVREDAAEQLYLRLRHPRVRVREKAEPQGGEEGEFRDVIFSERRVPDFLEFRRRVCFGGRGKVEQCLRVPACRSCVKFSQMN